MIKALTTNTKKLKSFLIDLFLQSWWIVLRFLILSAIKILRYLFLENSKITSLNPIRSLPELVSTESASNRMMRRRNHVSEVLKRVNSFDSFSDNSTHYDSPYQRTSNKKGKNVSFADPLTPTDENVDPTGDFNQDVPFNVDNIKFYSAGFE